MPARLGMAPHYAEARLRRLSIVPVFGIPSVMRHRDHQTLLDERYRGITFFKTLYRLIEGDRLFFLGSMIIYLFKHAPVWAAPLLTANIINAVTEKSDDAVRIIWMNSLIILFLYVQNVFSHSLFAWFISRVIRNLQVNLRGALIRRLQQLSIATYSDLDAGRVQSKILRDVETIEGLYNQLINVLLSGAITIIFASTVSLMKEPLMALFFLIAVPLALFFTHVFHSPLRDRNRAFREETESMATGVARMVDMIPVTRAHGLEEYEISRISRNLETVRQAGLRLDILNAVFGSASWATFQIFQLLCLSVCAYFAFVGRIKIGDVLMYQSFFMMIAHSVGMLLNVYPMITRGVEALHSIGEILE